MLTEYHSAWGWSGIGHAGKKDRGRKQRRVFFAGFRSQRKKRSPKGCAVFSRGFSCPGILVALPGYEIAFQRGLSVYGRSIITNIFSILGIMYMGNRE